MARCGGFSLIEMMVVLFISCTLAALVYPSYRGSVIRVRRGEAQGVLLRLMQQQERYYSQNNSYIAFSSSSGDPDARQFCWWSGSAAPTSAYEIEGKPCEGELISQCIRLVATPGTGNVDHTYQDDACGQLTLTSTGERLASGSAAHCWP